MNKKFFLIGIILALVSSGIILFSNHQNTLEGDPKKLSSPKYPVIYNGESLLLDYSIETINFFKPLFSPNRVDVNPSTPEIITENLQSRLRFSTPGEYYLSINGNKTLKILVLEKSKEISKTVLQVFDFLTANLIVTQGNDQEYYEDRKKFALDFFNTSDPKMLLCGPTLDFFEMILRDRFDLPVRDVTFTGVWMQGGQVRYSTHNMLEVYLPDKQKWMLFDVNNGFAIKWLDAFEITEKIRNASTTKVHIDKLEFDSIDFDYHYKVEPKRTINPADKTKIFSRDMLSTSTTREYWHDLANKLFIGGPGYWGGDRFEQNGLPSKYDLYLSNYHQDSFLLEAQVRWQGNWNLKVKHLKPKKLSRLLDKAYKKQIEDKAWLNKFSSTTEVVDTVQ